MPQGLEAPDVEVSSHRLLLLQLIVGAYETRLQDAAAEAADLRQALSSLQLEHTALENRQAGQTKVRCGGKQETPSSRCCTALGRSMACGILLPLLPGSLDLSSS